MDPVSAIMMAMMSVSPADILGYFRCVVNVSLYPSLSLELELCYC